MNTNNEPGLLRDLKCVLLLTSDRLALGRALKYGEDWLNHFIIDVGIYTVQDMIEDLNLQLRVCKTKLALSEAECSELRLKEDIWEGDIADYD